ncbi:charged multivesicular body protein 3 isoform X2 [Phoca vitulina]|uniref:charged multivesicular body protein 3 isoform X2 n=1 Tax=Phoca vitulina TaxID=9720 RepID=UPI0013964C6D|nr:charged multivesicular body protein 3 isoform X2 [Phoca vitulina]
MRTTFTAAAPFSGSLGSFPIACPAQAAARDLPGRRERKAGRGKTSSVRHGAVWENPGEAAQRADIQREEEKVKRSVKDAAKKGQKDVCVVLAKEMIRSRKAVSKLYASKAHMNSVLMGMKNQLAVLRVAGSLQKSTEVMKAMQSLVKIPEIQASMRELSKEMMKAGIIEEMLEDTFESMDDQEEMEEAAEMEIDKILFEITAGALGKAPSKVTDALPEPEPPGAMAASEDEEEEEEALEAMQSRLATLRS